MRTQSPNGDGKGIVRIVQILWKDSPLTSCRSSRTSRHYLGVVGEDDTWAGLADQFADEAYASVKGRVRTYVLHQQLLEHLPAPPALCSMSAEARAINRSCWPKPVTT